jgi:hypothetical protein
MKKKEKKQTKWKKIKLGKKTKKKYYKIHSNK